MPCHERKHNQFTRMIIDRIKNDANVMTPLLQAGVAISSIVAAMRVCVWTAHITCLSCLSKKHFRCSVVLLICISCTWCARLLSLARQVAERGSKHSLHGAIRQASLRTSAQSTCTYACTPPPPPHTHTRARAHAHARTHTHTHTRTHIHTHTRRPLHSDGRCFEMSSPSTFGIFRRAT